MHFTLSQRNWSFEHSIFLHTVSISSSLPSPQSSSPSHLVEQGRKKILENICQSYSVTTTVVSDRNSNSSIYRSTVIKIREIVSTFYFSVWIKVLKINYLYQAHLQNRSLNIESSHFLLFCHSVASCNITESCTHTRVYHLQAFSPKKKPAKVASSTTTYLYTTSMHLRLVLHWNSFSRQWVGGDQFAISWHFPWWAWSGRLPSRHLQTYSFSDGTTKQRSEHGWFEHGWDRWGWRDLSKIFKAKDCGFSRKTTETLAVSKS